ncbi:MAG TPA: glycosyltransferase [Opitutaceae bacterium]|nr:glycosyltransferase [Opitutaceae bacterium]
MTNDNNPTCFSVGLIARNGENTIRSTLEAVFQQSLFARLSACSGRCEVFCIACGCTDRTAEIAREVLARMEREHPHPQAFTARVAEISGTAKINAWNLFVHEFSAPETKYLYIMDDDTVLYHPDVLYNLAGTLERSSTASVSTSRRYKDVLFKPRKMAGAGDRRTTGQLYCLRASIARHIYPPRDPGVVGDGFLKAAICTDFFMHAPDPSRIVYEPEAAPVFAGMPPVGAREEKEPATVEVARRPRAREANGRKPVASRRGSARTPFVERFFPTFGVAFRRLWGRKRPAGTEAPSLTPVMAGLPSQFPGGKS